MSLDHLQRSDKLFWHRYLPFYEPYFNYLGDAHCVLEYGVYRGASVRYLSERFGQASIIGCDILAPLPEWPRSERINYVTLDQGNPQALEQLFDDHPGPFDLVIEDGSHEPTHQRNCLVATLPHVRPGGVYIVEGSAYLSSGLQKHGPERPGRHQLLSPAARLGARHRHRQDF